MIENTGVDKGLVEFNAVLLGDKAYTSKKGASMHQLKFSAMGMTFNMLSQSDCSAKVSAIEDDRVKVGKLTARLATFNDSLYLQFVSFDLI